MAALYTIIITAYIRAKNHSGCLRPRISASDFSAILSYARKIGSSRLPLCQGQRSPRAILLAAILKGFGLTIDL